MDERVRQTWNVTYHVARRIVIAVIGGTVVLLGIAMLVLPGPGLLTIVGGLALLGIEFAFARRWLRRIKDTTRNAVRKVSDRLHPRDGSPNADQDG